MRSRSVLTIAGSDSIAGAGIQADVKACAALGVYAVTAVTSITAQNTTGVIEVVPCSPHIVRAQIDAVTSDVTIAAVKTGMLATAEIVNAAAEALEQLGRIPLVVDPVMAAGGHGRTLLDVDAVSILKTRLLPLAAVVTPNAHEAAVLSGIPVDSAESARRAAEQIRRFGAAAVVVKGGHITGADSTDVLVYDGGWMEFVAPRADVREVHGTGCAFASAIAAGLALGDDIPAAVQRAKRYITGAIAHSFEIGRGSRILNHFWELSL